MQITISKETAKATRQAILVFANSIQEKKEDGSYDLEKMKQILTSAGLTTKDYLRLCKLIGVLDKKLNNNPKNKK